MLKKIALALSSLLAACSPAAPAQSVPQGAGDPGTQKSESSWLNPLDYEYIVENEDFSNSILKNVKKIHPDETLYVRFRLGNMAVVEGSYAPAVEDSVSQIRYLAVHVDSGAVTRLPDPGLFKIFSKAVRDPEVKMRLNTKIGILLKLGLEDSAYISGEEQYQPTWTEKDGVLVLTYYRNRNNGMERPTLEKCILTVDRDQNQLVTCTEHPDGKSE